MVITLYFASEMLSNSGLKAILLEPYRLALCVAPTYLARRPPRTSPWDLQQHECLIFAYTDGRSHWSLMGAEGNIEALPKSRVTINQCPARVVRQSKSPESLGKTI